jgi:hypothetical protein
VHIPQDSLGHVQGSSERQDEGKRGVSCWKDGEIHSPFQLCDSQGLGGYVIYHYPRSIATV